MPRDDYELDQEITTTNLTRVWTVFDPERHTVVLKQNLAGERGTRRFAREIKALQDAEGLHTMPVLDFDDTYDWYVMPYAAKTLDQVDTPASLELALNVLEAIAESLRGLHSKGQVHRDLKPENILWLQDVLPGRWVVADFGIVRNVPGETTRELTHAGGLIGTNRWAAPEQWKDGHSVIPRADVYAAGAIVSWILTGKLPDYTDPPLPESPAIRAVLRRVLSIDPAHRLSSMDDFLEKLRDAQNVKSSTLEQILETESWAALTEYIHARTSAAGRIARELPKLSPAQIAEWLSADPGGLLTSVRQITSGLYDRNGLEWSEVDRFLIWTVDVLRRLVANRMYPETEELATTVFEIVGGLTQGKPARKLLDWLATLAPPAQGPLDAALHASGQLEYFRDDATDRWEERGDNDLVRRLRRD